MSRMARIPTRDTRIERMMIGAARRIYDGPQLTQVVGLPGTPDLLLPDAKVVLSAAGCFWHQHGADHCPIAHVPPIGRTGFDWVKKFSATRDRDARNRAELIARGYRVAWCWECALIGAGKLEQAEFDTRLDDFIRGTQPLLELEGRPVGRPEVAA